MLSYRPINFLKGIYGELIREDGELHILHPIRSGTYSTYFIQGYPLGTVWNIGILHDIIEEKKTTLIYIKEIFGDDTRLGVEEMTNVYTETKYPNLSKKDRIEREFRRLSKVTNIVQQIKLCTRLDNVNTMSSLEFYKLKKKDYLEETEILLDHIGDANKKVKDLIFKKSKKSK